MTCLRVSWRQSYYLYPLNFKISIEKKIAFPSLKDRKKRGHKNMSLGQGPGSVGKALATKFDELSLTYRIHMVGGEN